MPDANLNMELIKLIISIATPVIILLLGVWAKNIAIDYEKRASLNDRIIKKRVEIYEKIGKELNDIFVFLVQVGDWKDYSPYQILDKKRNLDKIMYVNRPYWSDSAFLSYTSFMDSAFEMHTGIGEDAKIKTVTYQFETLESWEEDWKNWFSSTPTEMDIIREKYSLLMTHLSNEFGYYQDR